MAVTCPTASLLERAITTLQRTYPQLSSTALATNDHLTALAPSTPVPSPPPPPTPTDRLPQYQSQLVDAFLRSPGNEVLFLPTGLGECSVVDAIAASMLHRHPHQHIVICVVRPAQALSHAARLRASLGVTVGAFCGGDFLYNFEEDFKTNKVLVFTAGLLMRLTKLGIYKLDSASLLVLHDAFSAVRNHPMNTLVREYYWKGTGGTGGGGGNGGGGSNASRPRVRILLPVHRY